MYFCCVPSTPHTLSKPSLSSTPGRLYCQQDATMPAQTYVGGFFPLNFIASRWIDSLPSRICLAAWPREIYANFDINPTSRVKSHQEKKRLSPDSPEFDFGSKTCDWLGSGPNADRCWSRFHHDRKSFLQSRLWKVGDTFETSNLVAGKYKNENDHAIASHRD